MTDQPPPEKQAPPRPQEVRCPRCAARLGEQSGDHLLTDALRILRMRAVCRRCGYLYAVPGRGTPRAPEGRDPA